MIFCVLGSWLALGEHGKRPYPLCVGHAGPPRGSGPWRPRPGGSGMWLAQSFVTVAMVEQGPRLTGNWRCPP